jgi:aryl-alcohol dehydrogenase-like predicted oxidoreductase
VEREADKELLPYLRREGIVLIAWSPLVKGVLTGRYTPENPPAFEDVGRNDPIFTPQNLKLARPLVEELRRLAAAYGKTPAQLALNRRPVDIPHPRC